MKPLSRCLGILGYVGEEQSAGIDGWRCNGRSQVQWLWCCIQTKRVGPFSFFVDMLNGLVYLDTLEEFLMVILFWKKRALMAHCSSKMECCHIFTLQIIVSWIDSFQRSDLAEVPLSIWLLVFINLLQSVSSSGGCVKDAVCVLPIITTLLELTGRVQALMATLTLTMLMKVWSELYIQIWYLLGYSWYPDWTLANCYV